MAKSYYGYVKRDVENETNWAAITKSMTDMLSAEGKRREDKKADIDKASREFGQVLTDAEGSSHQGLSDFWLDGANNIQESRRMQDQLLKSGALKYRDYVSQRQNLTDGSNELIGLVKGFNSKWEAVKNDPNASEFDYANLANVQGFADFTSYRTWANPTDGRISLGKRVLNEDTGQYELSKNPNDFRQVSSLKNRMQQRAPKFEIDKFTKNIADRMGKYVKAQAIGSASTIEDVRKRPGYKEQLNNWVDSAMADEFNAASMGTDAFGLFKYEHDEKYKDQALADKDGVIYIGLNPLQKGAGMSMPMPTTAQKTAIKEKLIERIESQMPYIEKAAPRVSQADKTTYNNNKREGSQVSALANLQAGKTIEVREASAADIASRDENISQIVETQEDIFTITRDKDGNSKVTSTPRPENTNLFVTGAAGRFTNVTDLEAARKYSGITEGMTRFDLEGLDTLETITLPDGQVVQGNVLFNQTTEPKKKGGLQKFDEQIDLDFSNIETEGEQLITDTDFEDDATVIGKLTPLATKYGIRLVNPSRISESIQFLIGSGTNMVDQVIEFNDTTPKGLLESLKGFIKSNKDASERFLALDSEKTGGAGKFNTE